MPHARSHSIFRLLRSPSKGVAAVEFALVLPIFLILLAGLCDLGFGFYLQLQVQAAAEAGARYAAGHPWTDDAAMTAAVQSLFDQGAVGTTGISATPAPARVCGCTDGNRFAQLGPYSGGCGGYTGCSAGAEVYASIAARLSYSPVIPFAALPGSVILKGQAYRRLQ
jgi:TadE-like protein